MFVSLRALQGGRRHLAGRGGEEGGKKGVTTAQLPLVRACGRGGGEKRVTGGSESPGWVSFFPLHVWTALGAAPPSGGNQRSANRRGVGLNKLMSWGKWMGTLIWLVKKTPNPREVRIYGRGQRLPVLSGSRLKAPRGPLLWRSCTSIVSMKGAGQK